jgi:hypothetical protein
VSDRRMVARRSLVRIMSQIAARFELARSKRVIGYGLDDPENRDRIFDSFSTGYIDPNNRYFSGGLASFPSD